MLEISMHKLNCIALFIPTKTSHKIKKICYGISNKFKHFDGYFKFQLIAIFVYCYCTCKKITLF